MSFDYGKYFGEIKLTHDLLTKRRSARGSSSRPRDGERHDVVLYLGLQRAPHLAHDPDGDRHLRPARPRLRGRRRADVLLRHPAPPAGPGGLGRALRQPHDRAAPEDGAARGRHVVPVVHPVLRRGARRPSCRSPSATPPSSSPTASTAASSRSPSASSATVRAPLSPRGEPREREGLARRRLLAASPASRSSTSSPTRAGAGRARRRCQSSSGPRCGTRWCSTTSIGRCAAGATHMAGIYHGCHRDALPLRGRAPDRRSSTT